MRLLFMAGAVLGRRSGSFFLASHALHVECQGCAKQCRSANRAAGTVHCEGVISRASLHTSRDILRTLLSTLRLEDFLLKVNACNGRIDQPTKLRRKKIAKKLAAWPAQSLVTATWRGSIPGKKMLWFVEQHLQHYATKNMSMIRWLYIYIYIICIHDTSWYSMRNFSECQSQKPFNIIVAWCACQNGGFGRFNIQCYAILQSNQGLSK